MAQEVKRNHIDDYFKDRLYDYSPPAPDDMWMKIDGETKKRRKITLWVTLGALAASLTIIISLGIGYYFGSKQTMEQLSKKEIIENQNTISSSKPVGIAANNTKTAESNFNNAGVKDASENVQKPNNNNTIVVVNVQNQKSNVAPDYKREKKGLATINKLNTLTISKLPERRNSRLMVSKEVIAYYLEENYTPSEIAEIPKTHKNSWALGGSIAPLYSGWNVKSNSFYTNDYVKSIETPVMAYTGGLNVSVSSSRWKFESGINYMWANQDLAEVSENLYITKTNNNAYYSIDVNDPVRNNGVLGTETGNKNYTSSSQPLNTIVNNESNVYALNSKNEANTTYLMTNNSKSALSVNTIKDNAIQKSMGQNTSFIVIPFVAYYKIIDKKADVSISGGISTNVLIEAKRYLEIENEKYTLGSLESLRRFSYSGIIGLNFEVPVIKKLNLKVEPCINYNLKSIEKSSSIKIYPYSIGIYSGISYSF